MKALKALVIVLGLLIVAGVVLVIYGISSKVGPRPAAGTAAPATAAAPLPPSSTASFGTVAVPLTGGARIEQVLPVGERLVVRVAAPDGEELVVLDPTRGEIAGRFALGVPTLAGR